MKHLRLVLALSGAMCCLHPSAGHAVREPRPLAIDNRIRTVVYQENEVFKFVGHYGYQSSVEFEAGETVQTISVGDSTAWQIVPSGDRLFLKPIDKNATTNMTLISNKRVYHFELHASEAKDIRDPELVFVMRFLYPNQGGLQESSGLDSVPMPEFDDMSKYNFKYAITGSENVSPIKIFDDGTFTYFQFRKSAEIPAFFIVRPDGSEEIVNYRSRGDYIAIERIAARYTLRLGKEVNCVYNETMLPQSMPVK